MEKTQLTDVDLQKSIRKEMLAVRKAFAEHKNPEDLKIYNRLLLFEEQLSSDIYFVFVSYGTEVDTIRVIDKLLSLGKRVYAPKVDGGHMLFYRVKDKSDFIPGYKGILEPDIKFCERESDDLFQNACIRMLVPGLAFDLSGNRIGYGGGYYDRYIQRIHQTYSDCRLETVGLCYSFQITEAIPTNPWDQKLDYIISEYGIQKIE